MASSVDDYCSDDPDSDAESLHPEDEDELDEGWSYLTASQLGDFSISTVPVAGRLLADVKAEIKSLCGKTRRVLGVENVTLSDLANYNLSSTLPQLVSAIKLGLPMNEQIVDGATIVSFIRVLVELSIHRCAPTRYFDKRNKNVYTKAHEFDSIAFGKVMTALNAPQAADGFGSTWTAPFSTDVNVREAERAFTKSITKIALVKGVSTLSADDDHYRVQSAMSEQMGFTRINNPKKAFGIVSTNVVSLTTSIVLGMRLIGKNESFGDVVKILLMWMYGVDMVEQIEAQELICLDRGYLGPALLTFLMERGFRIIGTHKRGGKFPFTFGDVKGNANRRWIEERGAKGLYVAMKKYGSKMLYGMVYRGGRGRAAALVMNQSDFTTWIYRPKKIGSFEISAAGCDLVQCHIDDVTETVTPAQGGVEWHIGRVGLVTSTVAFKAMSICRAHTDSQAEKELMAMVGLEAIDPDPNHFIPLPERGELMKMKVKELRDLCVSRLLGTKGKKGELIARLLDPNSQIVSIEEQLLACWFVKPLANSYMKMGSANESNRGLLRRIKPNGAPTMLATSIDGAGFMERKANFLDDGTDPFEFVFVVEVKTSTSRETRSKAINRLEAARRLTGNTSQSFFKVQFINDHIDLCRTLVWLPQHRAQCLHHVSVMDTSNCLFVCATDSTITYTVLIQFTEELIATYRSFIDRITAEHLIFFSSDDINKVPQFTSSAYEHAVDADTVMTWRKLAAAIKVARSPKSEDDPTPVAGEAMFAPGHDLLPVVVSHWNHVKGGQDVCSRILKNVKVDFRKMSPRAFIFVRFVMTELMNTHMLLRLLNNEESLQRYESYHALKRSLNRDSSFWEFLRNFNEEWVPSSAFMVPQVQEETKSDDDDMEMQIGAARRPSGLPMIPYDELAPLPRTNRLAFLNKVAGQQRRFFPLLHANYDQPRKTAAGNVKTGKCPVCMTQTTSFCKVCAMAVCNQLFGNQKTTCFHKVHNVQRLRAIQRPPRAQGKGRAGRATIPEGNDVSDPDSDDCDDSDD